MAVGDLHAGLEFVGILMQFSFGNDGRYFLLLAVRGYFKLRFERKCYGSNLFNVIIAFAFVAQTFLRAARRRQQELRQRR